MLFRPEIPPNTGNIIRLCANTGAALHLVRPLGFDLSERRVRRAGLDYHHLASVTVHEGWAEVRAALAGRTWYAVDIRGTRSHADVRYRDGDVLLFGAEQAGLPPAARDEIGPDHLVRIPMVPGSRSMNLSNAVAVMLFEAWRQLDFAGAGPDSAPLG